MNITDIADALEGAPRQGAAVDDPEESSYVVFSDMAIQRITRELRLAAAVRANAESFRARQEPK